MMRRPGPFVFALGLLLAAPALAPIDAASKEQQQMMADIRMLQQQNQRLQAQLAAVTDLLKAVTARLDEQGAGTRKGFADQKVLTDTMGADLRVVREKIDETNVRLRSLLEEVETLRAAQNAALAAAPAPPSEPDAAPAGGPPAQPAPRPGSFGASPSQAFESARSDYYMGQWSLAIQGFESYLKTFPRSDLADDAQYYIGETYYMSGRFQDAVAAYNLVIERYPGSNTLPDAYYKRGLALATLGQVDAARESLSFAVATYPDSDAGRLAKQALDKLSRAGK
ncbi:MAG TPA: tol-pal system protein YbgF [Vicinamibacterales bacterium]|nr:tol-pal system protein YbgF [Vicinamibacterales bacterium]HOG29965.1 tol-pal system protein YbgF [Vicinamibacterales bacterium]HOQ60537.1 tol-pal system protein YbgF [Vicinamibacterales bacterium]HPW21890.1 tol-pal system protein YbgF [Vicinamibacterales bacterium]